jgi:hypothetical protein
MLGSMAWRMFAVSGGSLKSEFPGFLRNSPAFFDFFDGFSQFTVEIHDS